MKPVDNELWPDVTRDNIIYNYIIDLYVYSHFVTNIRGVLERGVANIVIIIIFISNSSSSSGLKLIRATKS